MYYIIILLAEISADGKKKPGMKYPGYFGGCREDLPGQGGPWAFPNDCKDYTVSRKFLGAFQDGDGTRLTKAAQDGRLKIDNFNTWLKEIKETKDEKCTEKDTMGKLKFKYDYKVETCYCKNEKDENGNDVGTPCNGKKENGTWKTIGVSKSGVATLALTIVLLAISIIGTYERVLKGYFN